MTNLSLTRNDDGSYALAGDGPDSGARMRVDWRVRNGQITAGDETVSIRALGFGRRRVTLGPADSPVLELDPAGSRLADHGAPVRWEIGRNVKQLRAELTSGSARITLVGPVLHTLPVEIEVAGVWPNRDRMVLSACFALMSRRRREVTILAISSN